MFASTSTLNECKDQLECLAACRSRPIKKFSSLTTIKDLLSSKIAIGPNVNTVDVEKALDELIDLQSPFINRILEISAYHCARNELFIYIASNQEFFAIKEKSTGGCLGFYNPNLGLIVASTLQPLSQILIHELTHAIRHRIHDRDMHDVQDRHKKYCKQTFPTLFKQAIVNNEPLKHESEELANIEMRLKNFLDVVKDLPFAEQQDIYGGPNVFRARRNKVSEQQRLRREFYDLFTPYNLEDYTEEFLPFLFTQFVRYAYHSRLLGLEVWLKDFRKISNLDFNREYHIAVLGMIMSSLPESLTKDFILGDFRVVLDRYAFKVKNNPELRGIETLIDDELYNISGTEPKRIRDYKIYPDGFASANTMPEAKKAKMS